MNKQRTRVGISTPSLKRRLQFEPLEDRKLLATIIYETYKTLDYHATGTFAGQTRADIMSPNDFHDDYSGAFTFAGSVAYNDHSVGNSTSGSGTGTGSGSENCPPNFGQIDTYAYAFDATNQIGVNGTQIGISLSTTSFVYSNPPCMGPYSAGSTPFDDTFSGTLDISSIPYKAVLDASSSGNIQTELGPRPYRNSGAINVDLTPYAEDEFGAPIAFDIDVVDIYQHNGLAQVEIAISGPTLAAPSPTTIISDIKVYFASGPEIANILGPEFDSYPLYWNSGNALLRLDMPAELPVGATHIIAIADGQSLLEESSESNNFFVDELQLPGAIYTYSFTAEVTQAIPNAGAPEQAPIVNVGDIISGTFSYDSTGAFGNVSLTLNGFPQLSTEYFNTAWFDYDSDSQLDFALLNEVYVPQWDLYPWVQTDLYFSGPAVVDGVIPASLAGLQGAMRIGSEAADGFSNGFTVLADFTSLTRESTLAGIDVDVEIDEETIGTVDIATLFAVANVQVDSSTLTVTNSTQHGSLSINYSTGVVTYLPAANFSGTDSFRYSITDIDGNLSSEAEVIFTVIEVPEPYQNPAGAYFVNADDLFVTSLDAALVITELNATGPRLLSPPPVGTIITVFFDVDGDNRLTPLDAALIIIYLNSPAQGEGGDVTLPEVATTPEKATSEPIAFPLLEQPTNASIDYDSASSAPVIDATEILLSPLATTTHRLWFVANEEESDLADRAFQSNDLAIVSERDWWQAWWEENQLASQRQQSL